MSAGIPAASAPATSGPLSLPDQVVVLCGGLGSRLGELTRETPKPLLSVGGEPFLFRLL